MATTEPVPAPIPPAHVGRHLRALRKAKGLSRSEVARSAGLTRRELAAYERGKVPIPESDLWCLAGSCGVDVAELLPGREPLPAGSGLPSLTIGESIARLRATAGHDPIPRELLALVYELRNLPPGSRPPMREQDLAALADALGGTPEAIEARLHELIGASREEAARLRAMILPPRTLAAADPPIGLAPNGALAGATPVGSPAMSAVAVPGATGPSPAASACPPLDLAAPTRTIGDPAATDRFLGAAYAEDPFAPPRLETFDPFAAPEGPALGAFAPPTGPPLPPPVGVHERTLAGSTVGSPPAPSWLAPPTGGGPTRPVDPYAGHTEGGAPTSDPDVEAAFWGGPVATEGLEPLTTGAMEPGGLEIVALEPLVGDGPFEGRSPTRDHDDGLATTDPLAVLRIPLADATAGDLREPAAGAGGADPWPAEVPGPEVSAARHDGLPLLDPPIDPFADAFTIDDAVAVHPEVEPAVPGPLAEAADRTTPPPEPAAEPTDPIAALARPGLRGAHDLRDGPHDPDEEPTDEWFDRAAAAAAVLVAEARRPDGADPVESAAERAEPTLRPIAWALDALGTRPDGDPSSTRAVPGHRADPVLDAGFVAAGTSWHVGGTFPATATADDGALALRRADVRWALADLTADHDFTLRAVVDFTSGAGFGILFRVETGPGERITGYSFDVDPIYSGGGFLLRQWNDGRQHWKPLAHAPVADSSRLFGAHTIEITLRADELVARVDGEVVLTVHHLSRRSIDSGQEPCRGHRVGVQAWSTTEVTVDRLLLANH